VSAVTGIAIIVIAWALFALHELNILSAVSRPPKHDSRPPPHGAPEAANSDRQA
jgi:hypothetical protein